MTTPPSHRPPGYYTGFLGGLLALASSIACLYLWADQPSMGILIAVSGWGFAGIPWALGGIATQVRDARREQGNPR